MNLSNDTYVHVFIQYANGDNFHPGHGMTIKVSRARKLLSELIDADRLKYACVRAVDIDPTHAYCFSNSRAHGERWYETKMMGHKR